MAPSTLHPPVRSQVLQQAAEKVIPGGVDSPVRAFRAVGGEPRWMWRGQGSWLEDVDGNRYLDYIGSWGAMLLGHAHPYVVAAVKKAAENGFSFGTSTPSELQLAEEVRRRYPRIDKVRFVSSGTEATMSAIRLARGFTGRPGIIKFEGCYHGHADALLVKAGSGVATLGLPASAGVPEAAVADTLALPYNDLGAVERAFQQHPERIAAIIVEPVVGNMGCVPPAAGFLAGLHALAHRHGALLILDEVMTGFRLAAGGATELLDLTGDLWTLGKVLGGGLPVGAYGGRAEIMDQVAPLGPVYQAGTLSGNPLAMSAGLATLEALRHDGDAYARLDHLGAELQSGLEEAIAAAGVPACVQRVGSMWTLFFAAGPITNYGEAARCDTAAFGRFHRAMLEQGILLPPAQFEAAFLSLAHEPADIERTIVAARHSLRA